MYILRPANLTIHDIYIFMYILRPANLTIHDIYIFMYILRPVISKKLFDLLFLCTYLMYYLQLPYIYTDMLCKKAEARIRKSFNLDQKCTRYILKIKISTK